MSGTKVAPLKLTVKSLPWINIGCKTEHLWKAANILVHRLHRKDLFSIFNVMLKGARASYFSKLISEDKRHTVQRHLH